MMDGHSVSGASVGVNVGRLDGRAKVTGAARYLADLPPREGELLGATVRSQVSLGISASSLGSPGFFPGCDLWAETSMVVPPCA